VVLGMDNAVWGSMLHHFMQHQVLASPSFLVISIAMLWLQTRALDLASGISVEWGQGDLARHVHSIRQWSQGSCDIHNIFDYQKY
jgi:hypothetical protein